MKFLLFSLILAILIISSQAIDKGKPKLKENFDDVELTFDGKISQPGHEYTFTGSMNPSKRKLDHDFQPDFWFYLQNDKWQWKNLIEQETDKQQSTFYQDDNSKQQPLLKSEKQEDKKLQKEFDKKLQKNDLLKDVTLEKEITDQYEKELYEDYSSPMYRKHELNPEAFIFSLGEINKCEINVNDQKKVEFKIKKLFNKKDVRFDVDLQFKHENHTRLKEFFQYLADKCVLIGKKPQSYYRYKYLYKKEQEVKLCFKVLPEHFTPKLKEKCEKKQRKYCDQFELAFSNRQDCYKYSVSKEMRMSLGYQEFVHNPLVELGLSRRLRNKNSKRIKSQMIQN